MFGMTDNLNNYPRLPISQYKQAIRNKLASGEVLDIGGINVTYIFRGKEYKYKIRVTRTPCNYGSYRYWWLCPKCSRRTSVLYCCGSYVCRHCMQLGYKSQLATAEDRAYSRVEVIRERLGWQRGIAHGQGKRPKGMHRKTYDKLVNEHYHLSKKILNEQMAYLKRLGVSNTRIS